MRTGQGRTKTPHWWARLKTPALLPGITQPEVSQIANGRLSGFTFDRLYRCLQVLDVDTEIIMKKHPLTNNSAAGIHVSHLNP
ncbi:MAG: XRE family transcriptional regulator [Gammaproteobacteria bacterium]